MREKKFSYLNATRFSYVAGLFLRRIIIFFDKLTFSQVVAVYRSFKAYYYRAKVAGADLGGPLENPAVGASTVGDSMLSEDMHISSTMGMDSEYKFSSPVGVGMKTELMAL